MTVDASQRYNSAHPCPVCGGYEKEVRGKGVRCIGFLSTDGEWARCSREQYSGRAKYDPESECWVHKVNGKCKCERPHVRPGMDDEGPPRMKVGGVVRHVVRDVEGRPLAVHARQYWDDDTKTMWWEHPDGSRGLPRGLVAKDMLYGAERLREDPKKAVVLVEGEPSADALNANGVLAVGTVTGAPKGGATSDHSHRPTTTALAMLGRRRVAIWADADPKGQGETHFSEAASILNGLGALPCIVTWTDAPPKGDADDYLQHSDRARARANGNHKGTVEELRAMLNAAPAWEPPPDAPVLETPVLPCKLPQLELGYLPAPLGELAAHMASIWNCDPALYAVPGLAVLSNAIGNTAFIQLPGGQIAPALLWVAIVAHTGSGKTPAAVVVRRPLLVEQEPLDRLYIEQLQAWKQMSKGDRERTPRPTPQQVIAIDSTWPVLVQDLGNNPGGILWWRDELAATFKQLGGDAKSGAYGSDDILGTWSQEPIRRRRVSDGEVTIIPHPFLPIYGGIQPKNISELGSNDSGRLSRLLCYQTDRWPALDGADPDPKVVAGWDQLVGRLLRGRIYSGRHRMLQLSDEARLLWKEKQRDRSMRIRDVDDDTAAFLAKLDQHSGRIACIIHVAEHPDEDGAVVDGFTIERGWGLAETFLRHQLATYSPTVSDFVVTLADKALDEAAMRVDEWILKQGGRVTKAKLQTSHIGGARNKGDFKRLLDRWLEMECGHEEGNVLVRDGEEATE